MSGWSEQYEDGGVERVEMKFTFSSKIFTYPASGSSDAFRWRRWVGWPAKRKALGTLVVEFHRRGQARGGGPRQQTTIAVEKKEKKNTRVTGGGKRAVTAGWDRQKTHSRNRSSG